MEAKTKDAQPGQKVYSKQPENNDSEIDNKIKEYAKEHNVSYMEAFDAIAINGGE